MQTLPLIIKGRRAGFASAGCILAQARRRGQGSDRARGRGGISERTSTSVDRFEGRHHRLQHPCRRWRSQAGRDTTAWTFATTSFTTRWMMPKAAMGGMLAPEQREGSSALRDPSSVRGLQDWHHCWLYGHRWRGPPQRSFAFAARQRGHLHRRTGILKRFRDDVKGSSRGFECGLNIKGYNDIGRRRLEFFEIRKWPVRCIQSHRPLTRTTPPSRAGFCAEKAD